MPPVFFVDANIIFTAAISPGGQGRALFDLAAGGYCKLVSSPYAMEEARRNVRAKYPGRVNDLNLLLSRLTVVPEADPALTDWAGEHVEQKDAPILAAALGSGAESLVTGDKRHFSHLFGHTIRTITVTTLAQALEQVLTTDP